MSEAPETLNPYEISGPRTCASHPTRSRRRVVVVCHADVHAVMRDHETFSSEVSLQPPEERGAPSMLFSDPQNIIAACW